MIRILSLILIASTASAQSVTFSTVASNPYFAGDINSCAISLNNLTTVGNYQFIGYYDNNRNMMIGRRTLGSSAWTTYSTGVTVATNEITDDHNVIALAVDSNGKMHVSYNMHNQALNYSMSNASVLTPSLPTISFTKLTTLNAPTLFPSAGATTNAVTYPIFLPIPNSNNLLFTYRNGGTGGGSGNGNQYFNVYNPTSNTWSNNLVIDGISNSVNAYLNSPAYDTNGNLHISWTWRATSNWQTNSNIMYAQSPSNGATWFRQGGTTQYTLPIIQSGTPATSVGQIIKTIPQNSSFINQTSMAMDQNNHPIIATWYASESGLPDRQYVVVYHDGSTWQTSQITHRTSDTTVDSSGANVRDLGRPIVLVDGQNRVLVVTRSEDTAMGASTNPATPNNNIMVYWTNALNGSSTIWNSLTLDSANMGVWEPTYDSALWQSQHKLSLVYEPVGLTGQSSGTLKVLDWDSVAYFASIPEPGLILVLGAFLVFAKAGRGTNYFGVAT